MLTHPHLDVIWPTQMVDDRDGGTYTDALDQLRARSQNDHVELVDLARSVVDEAVRRANARRA